MVMNANSAPELEELPVSDRAAALIHAINVAHFPSQLRRIGGSQLIGLSAVELDIIRDEKAARQKQLMVASSEEPPVEVLEASAPSEAAQWSPTGILDAMPEREYDARERAAGEHLDR